jgi:hypothetical protein
MRINYLSDVPAKLSLPKVYVPRLAATVVPLLK